MPRPGHTTSPDAPRAVQTMVVRMAEGLTPRDIHRLVPWINRANLATWLRGGSVRLSEKAIDQIMHAIEHVRSTREVASCPEAN